MDMLVAKNYLVNLLSPATLQKLRKLGSPIVSRLFAHNLPALAIIAGTDKWGAHWYAQHYQNHFAPLRRQRLNILEIGVGGFADPTAGGASLRMWKSFFPRALIHAVDIVDKTALQEPRIKIFQGSQDDPDFLRGVVREMGTVDIIIDDGSHRNEHVLKSFEILFPLLAENGIYAIEDMQTSYWQNYGGTSKEFNDRRTSMGYFKSLIDGLNHDEYLIRDYGPTYLDRNIVSMHFYHNLAFIYKGRNQEGSVNKPAIRE